MALSGSNVLALCSGANEAQHKVAPTGLKEALTLVLRAAQKIAQLEEEERNVRSHHPTMH